MTEKNWQKKIHPLHRQDWDKILTIVNYLLNINIIWNKYAQISITENFDKKNSNHKNIKSSN